MLHSFMTIRSLLLLILLLILSCCHDHSTDPRLSAIEDLADTSPAEALDSLGAIDHDLLSDASKHYYDFLSVKIPDKAYVTHTSDSLILKVIGYESKHRSSGRYPEALYYGGRVYSDLGDYPTALDFFRKSLDNIPKCSDKSTELKTRVLSQTARLLNRMRLYDRAQPYLLEVLKLDSLRDDTFRLAYDNELLGSVFMRQNRLTEAEESFGRAARWARFLTDMDQAHMQAQMALTSLYKGDTMQAVSLIGGIPERVRPIQRNQAMIHASNIYKAAGISDSAYLFADRLVHSPDINNRKNGYRNMFSEELADMIPADSARVFIRNYYNCLEDYYNDHDAQLIMLQETMYDYQLHQRQREEAEYRSRLFTYITVGLVFVVLTALILILYMRNRRNALLMRLSAAIREIECMREKMTEKKVTPSYMERPEQCSTSYVPYHQTEVDDLKGQLIQQIGLLVSQSEDKVMVSSAILNSDVFDIINRYIECDRPIPDNSQIWEQLEQQILSEAPAFKQRLRLLTGKNLKPQDYHYVMLVRCGIPQTQMKILLGRSKSTISYRRKVLSAMMMGPDGDPNMFDKIIHFI